MTQLSRLQSFAKPIALIVLAMAAIGLAIYAFEIEPRWLEVTHIRLYSPHVKASSGSIRIALFSDLHCDVQPGLEMVIAPLIEAEHPDIIVFPGDSVNCREAYPRYRKVITEIAKIAPTFAVKGDWDFSFQPYLTDLDFFGNTGIVKLPCTLNIRSTKIFLIGTDAGGYGKNGPKYPIPPDALSIFIYHNPEPEIIHLCDRLDLFLCGHTHGGQVALPWYGAIWTHTRYGKKYERGLYNVDGTSMYVTRGLGMEGKLPRVRFLARPELTILDVMHKSETN